jgi:sortase A
MRRIVRILGTLSVVAGVLLLAWALVVWRWQDPFTALYTRYEQHKLGHQYAARVAHFHPPALANVSVASERAAIAREARAYRLASRRGQVIGHIRIPHIGAKYWLVNGTDHDSLMKGPGRDLRTYMPGEGELIYIAGHRTTYLAPFSHIDDIVPGDRIWIELPYATFVYRMQYHVIVPADDLAVLKSHGREQLVLQACHPRFFATHRYLVYARLVQVQPRGAPAFSPIERLAAAP